MSQIKTVGDLLRDFFDTHPEYNGIYNPHGDCACTVNDLFPCGVDASCCRFGVEVPCDCGDHDSHVVDPDSINQKDL